MIQLTDDENDTLRVGLFLLIQSEPTLAVMRLAHSLCDRLTELQLMQDEPAERPLLRAVRPD